MSKSFTDLYTHGAKLNALAKSAFKKFKHYSEQGDTVMAIAWAESFRKATMNCVDVAKCVLGVESLLKGKKLSYGEERNEET